LELYLEDSLSEPIVLVLLSYVRSLFGTIFSFIWTFGYGCVAIFVLMIFPSQRLRDFFYRTWGAGCVFLFGVEVELRGGSFFPMPGQPGSVCLFNHTSNFDIPVVNSVLRGSVRWGAKIELLKSRFLVLSCVVWEFCPSHDPTAKKSSKSTLNRFRELRMESVSF
jgi:1-acyl-sn-glycerol-3-phosphate acyltransferase